MKRFNAISFVLLISALVLCLFNGQAFAANQADEITLEGIAPDQVDSVLAKLSDEQVRSLLVAELAREVDADKDETKASGGIVQKATSWLHILDHDPGEETKSIKSISSASRFGQDYIAIAQKIGNGSLSAFFKTIGLVIALFIASYLAEFMVRRFTAPFSNQFKENAIPDMDGPMRFIAGIMRSIPAMIHIMFFAGTAIGLFFLIPASDHAEARYLFLAILFILVFFRLTNQMSKVMCAPETPFLRILPINDTTAASLHKGVILLWSYTFSVVMFLALLMELELAKPTFILTLIVFATLLIAIIITMIIRSRGFVRDRILRQSELNKTRNWIVEQFANLWHVPTIFYFSMLLVIMVGDQINGVEREGSAFLLSLLILPLFVFFDGIGQWVVRVSIKTLRIYNPTDEDLLDEELKDKLAQIKEKERKILVTTSRLVRIAVLAALLVWVFCLWGYNIPYAMDISHAIFESLITIAMGLIVWRFASSYIERKIKEATPEDENDKEEEDEFGGAKKRGRSYTLLPMLRKFVAITLLVMVSLVLLSAIGVDIGPLLAGAGVVGLAIGFGAQKLVSDIFSGFFYLLDDAFRVGEYIKAGSVSGSVEAITLRNVMLRHHRGMLQIVPHSDMGSITNFMRGGIIVKFNLEFAYDADVNKIRKVIKKVGQTMIKDEEFADDFILPIKSGGVREIKGSVMVIRVKFKAQPGTHFVIRREAYRRITEALAKKGIHYAHRKVIVELPKEENDKTPEQKKKDITAAAGAALTQLEEEEKQTASSKKDDIF